MKNEVKLYAPMLKDSIVDGEGIRTVIWFQGCPHHCPGCHNPESHSFNAGMSTSLEDLKEEIRNLTNQDGITFSGGEPFSQISALYELVKCAKEENLNIWAYSGFTFEELLEKANDNPLYLDTLRMIDVLVDGKFELQNRNLAIKFRGSTNQRILDVKKSLNKGSVVQIAKYKIKSNNNKTIKNLIYI